MSRLRFAVMITHPIQHYSPIFKILANDPGIDLKVFYLCDHAVHESFDSGFNTKFSWDIDLLSGYDHEFLRPGFTSQKFGFFECDAPNLEHKLDQFKPHAMWVHGYGQRFLWRAVTWAQHRAAVIYFGDSELVHARSPLKRLFKEVLVRRFFQSCTAFITIGDNNEAYYRHYGVSDDKLFRGACPIDVQRFSKAAESITKDQRLELRMRYGLPKNAFVVITSGKLESRKRPLDVVKAVVGLQVEEQPIHVLMIGDGVLREEVEKYAQQTACDDRVTVTGFINQAELPYLVAIADALVMPSEMDPHPLAVSEALPVGLPIIASDKIGCVGVSDTARPGVNTIVYPCGDSEALGRAIVRLQSDSELLKRYSNASRDLAPSQSFDVAVQAVLRALLSVREDFAEPWSEVYESHFDNWQALLS